MMTLSVVGQIGVLALGSLDGLGSGGLVFEQTLLFNGDNGPFAQQTQQVADGFTVQNETTLGLVSWYGSFDQQGDPLDAGDPWPFTIRFFQDNGLGMPEATPFLEFDAMGLVAGEGPSQAGDTFYQFWSVVPETTVGPDVQYYISILSAVPGGFRWSNGTPDDGVLHQRGEDGAPWEASDDPLRNGQAFALFGTVPAPAAFALFGAAGLIHARRRRR